MDNQAQHIVARVVSRWNTIQTFRKDMVETSKENDTLIRDIFEESSKGKTAADLKDKIFKIQVISQKVYLKTTDLQRHYLILAELVALLPLYGSKLEDIEEISDMAKEEINYTIGTMPYIFAIDKDKVVPADPRIMAEMEKSLEEYSTPENLEMTLKQILSMPEPLPPVENKA